MDGRHNWKVFTIIVACIGCGSLRLIAGSSESQGVCPHLIPACPLVTVNGDVIQYVIKTKPALLENFLVPEEAKGLTNYVCTKPACLSNPCLDNEACQETMEGYVCYGTACSSNPCQNGGTCRASTEGYSCDCLHGFKNSYCQSDRHLVSVSLFGGNISAEGRVEFISKSYDGYMSSYSWSMNISHMVCQELGFTGASATLSGGIFPGFLASSESRTVGEIDCLPNYRNLTECSHNVIHYGNRNATIEWLIAVRCCTPSKCSPPGRALGMGSGNIPDADITTSSCAAASPCGQDARLDSVTPWIPSSADQNPYIQVRLGAYHMITAIITRGGNNEWVTSFKILYGSDEADIVTYTDVDNEMEIPFPGNYDANTTVTTSFIPYILAKYIRINPKSWHNSVSMRFELVGYGPLPDYIDGIHTRDGVCVAERGVPLGMENGHIADGALSASTSETGHEPHHARLNSAITDGWIPLVSDTNPFLKVDLTTRHLVTGVITQGHRTLDQWTTSVTLSFETDQGWISVYENTCGSRKIFPTNYDNNTPVTILLADPVTATKVRINPQSWNVRVTLRCEILGKIID